jgi:hypothetical protein
MAKKFSKVLPIGTLVYPKLDRIDVYQPLDKKGKPSGEEKRRWLVNVKFEDAEHREVQAWLDDVAKQAGLDRPKLPWRKDKKTGELWLVAASGEQYKPSLYGANNEKLPTGVFPGGGSKARIFVNANAYDGFGGGINLYLSSVQVLDLKESSFGKSPFEQTEGYAPEASAATDETKEFDPHEASKNSDDMSDEIPF